MGLGKSRLSCPKAYRTVNGPPSPAVAHNGPWMLRRLCAWHVGSRLAKSAYCPGQRGMSGHTGEVGLALTVPVLVPSR